MSYVGKGTNINALVDKIIRVQLSVILVIALVVSSFFNVRKAEAIVPAIPAAGAAIAALAAEIGISEGALMAGIVAITAAGTGYYLLDSSNQTDFISQGQYDRLWTGDLGSGYTENWADGYQNWRGPNGDTWGDLSPEEQSEYSSPADYVHSGLASLAVLFPDLFQVGNGGDLEPTPEPDPELDPQGHSKWVKARNVLIALAAGTGGVALSDATGMLADNLAGSIKGFLFGGDGVDYGLGLVSRNTYSIAGVPINYMTFPGGSSGNYSLSFNGWFCGNQPSTGTFIILGSSSGTNTSENITVKLSNNVWKISYPSNRRYGISYTSSGLTTGNSVPTNIILSTTGFLNSAYAGNYVFMSGDNQIAGYTNGVMTGNYSLTDVDYDQLSDTPIELAQNVYNDNSWNNYINNYTDAGNDETRTITIPNFGDGTNNPDYSDFIDVVPDADVVPIPDDVVNPSPNPNPNPGTGDFQEDFGQRVQRLLAQPFNQVFPFCLIGDLQDLLELMHDAAYREPTRDVVIVNGTSRFVIPLDGFGLEGIEDFTIDMSPVIELGHMVRGLTTALFITGLLVGSFRFFLNKGGE